MPDIAKPCDAPCPKCGSTDIYRRFFAAGAHMENSRYDVSPSKYASGLCHSFAAYRDHLQNTCRCCGFIWQTLPLPKPRKSKPPAPPEPA